MNDFQFSNNKSFSTETDYIREKFFSDEISNYLENVINDIRSGIPTSLSDDEIKETLFEMYCELRNNNIDLKTFQPSEVTVYLLIKLLSKIQFI